MRLHKTFTLLIALVGLVCTFGFSVFAASLVQKQDIKLSIFHVCPANSEAEAEAEMDESPPEFPGAAVSKVAFDVNAKTVTGRFRDRINKNLTEINSFYGHRPESFRFAVYDKPPRFKAAGNKYKSRASPKQFG